VTDTVEHTSSAAPADAATPEAEHFDVFISYSHRDRELAVRLRDSLVASGKGVWLDEVGIRGGTRWRPELERAIEHSYVFVFLVSPASIASKECQAELAHALRLGKRLLPVRAAETPIGSLPPALAEIQLIPARELFETHFDASLETLITEIEIDRDWVREHTEWAEKAVEWERENHNRAYLLSGSELELAEGFRARAAGKRPQLSKLQNEYIDASRASATRRLRRLSGSVSIALVVAIGLSIFALIQRQDAVNQSRVARSGQLAAESVLHLSTDPQLSLLLADAASRTHQTPAALDALRRALPSNDLVRTLAVSGDTQPLNDAQWSPDGLQVLTASEDGYGRVWDVSTGKVVRRFPMSTYYTQGASFDGRGDKVMTWGPGGIKVWSLSDPSAQPVSIPDPTGGKLEGAAIDPAGRVVAATPGPGEGTLALWDAVTGRRLHALAGVGSRYPRFAMGSDVEFGANGRLMASTLQGVSAVVWDVRSGRPVMSVTGPSHTEFIQSAAISPDGSRLLTSNGNIQTEGGSSSQVWNIRSHRRLANVNGGYASWSPGGGYISTNSGDGTTRVWRANTGRLISQLKASSPLSGMAVFGPDVGGDIGLIATGSLNGGAIIWNALAGTQVAVLQTSSGEVVPAGFSHDGSRVLTYSSDGAARVWETGIVQPTPGPNPAALKAASRPVTSDVLSSEYYRGPDPGAPLEAVADAGQRTVSVYAVGTGQRVARLREPSRYTFPVAAFDARGRRMIIANSGAAPELRLAHGGALLHRLPRAGTHVTAVAMSSNGELAATLDDHNRIAVWSVDSGQRLALFTGHVSSKTQYGQANVDFSFSPDGSLMVSEDEAGREFVWRTHGGQVLNRIHGVPVPAGQHVGMAGAISPDDRLVATTSSWDQDAHVYRVGASKPLLTLSGHSAGILDVEFSPDSSLLASVADIPDNTVRVWDTREQDPVETIAVGLQRSSAGDRLEFSADGGSLLTNGVTPYETIPCVVCGGFGRLLVLAKHRELRGFTDAERQLYLGG
jgi:WD40 repeat protein